MELVVDREAWRAVIRGIAKSRKYLSEGNRAGSWQRNQSWKYILGSVLNSDDNWSHD